MNDNMTTQDEVEMMVKEASHVALIEFLKQATLDHAQTKLFSRESRQTQETLSIVAEELLRRLESK